MRKLCLAAAVVLMAVLVQPAFASDPLKVTVGGNVVTGFYVIDADNVGGTSYADTKVAVVAQNINIDAAGTLDNGMLVGVEAKLALGSAKFAFTTATNSEGFATFRQIFTYVEGSFGRVELGGTDGAAFKMHYTSPWFVPGNGVDYPNISNIRGDPGSSHVAVAPVTYSMMTDNANKVTYFTPRIMGLQLGGSFTPEQFNTTATANGLGLSSHTNGAVRNIYEIAVNYVGSVGSVGLAADGFYTAGQSGTSGVDPREYGFGTNIVYGGFTLGGAWAKAKDLDSTLAGSIIAGEDRKTWTAGMSYATGPWKVGLAYLHSDVRSIFYVGQYDGRKATTWQTGGGYNLGSGVDLGLDLLLEKNSLYSGAPTETSKSVGLVLDIGF